MNEKAVACRVLSIIVVDLHSALLPYISAIMHTLLPLLNTLPFQDIQMAVLVIMPDLLISIAESIYGLVGIENYRQSFNFILDTLLTFLVDDPDLELLIPSLQTLQLCLEKSVLEKEERVEVIGGAEISRIIDVMNASLKLSFERRAVRSADVEQEDWDEEEVEEFKDLENDENRANYLTSDVIGLLLRLYPRFALPLVHEIMLSDLMQLADESRTNGDKLVAIHVMEEIVSNCGKDAFQYYTTFVPIFLREIHSPDADLRYDVLRGLQSTVEVGKDLVCEIAPRCVKEIELVLDDPVSQDAMYEKSNALGVVVLGRVCVALGNYLIMLGEHFSFWLNHLACVKEKEMVEACVDMACSLLQRGEVAFVGDANQNILPILQYLCNSLGVVNDELGLRVVQMLKSIQSQSDPSLFTMLWNSLGNEKASFVKQRLDAVANMV